MSRSVSAPSSVTKTSPCWKGFIVPGSTLIYGSSFCIVTRRPLLLSRRPSEEAVSPFPRLDATPPVTKMCLTTTTSASREPTPGARHPRRNLREGTGGHHRIYHGARHGHADGAPSACRKRAVTSARWQVRWRRNGRDTIWHGV